MLQNLLLQQQTSKGILQAGTLSNYFLLFFLHTEVSCLSLRNLYPLIVFFSPVKGGVDAKDLFQDYINRWIQEKRLSLLESCKLDKVHLFFCSNLVNSSSVESAVYIDSFIDYDLMFTIVSFFWSLYEDVSEHAWILFFILLNHYNL